MQEYDITRKEYDANADFYFKRLSSFDWSGQIDRFSRFLLGKKVLDAGCGVGRDVGEFLKRDFEVDGIDYSIENLKHAKASFPKANFSGQNILHTSLPSGIYDGIWSCACILHLKKKDVPVALAEFSRLLKPRGKLFVSVKEGKGEKMVNTGAGERFFSFFSADELKKFVENSGFKILFFEVVPNESMSGTGEKINWLCVFAEKMT